MLYLIFRYINVRSSYRANAQTLCYIYRRNLQPQQLMNYFKEYKRKKTLEKQNFWIRCKEWLDLLLQAQRKSDCKLQSKCNFLQEHMTGLNYVKHHKAMGNCAQHSYDEGSRKFEGNTTISSSTTTITAIIAIIIIIQFNSYLLTC
jgi:hypothetical protein